jgi:hypothetical protein
MEINPRRRRWLAVVLAFVALMPAAAAEDPRADRRPSPEWTIYVANDNCPDYTWGLTEEQTRQAFADVVKGHLDEMRRTDGQPPEGRDCYNAAVTQEVLCFIERHPERKAELAGRIREGRLYVSPYLCNSLWAFQGFEGALRTFYPARRLERELGIRIDCAHHIELPSLPWGTATVLAGCGIKRLSLPFYNYDSTFGELKTPPVFRHEGPDGSSVLVAMDRFACSKASYAQGAAILNKPEAIGREWIAHYAALGKEYPLRSILASGTHGDISPGSGGQARAFADKIIQYNGRADKQARLVNATMPRFWAAVESHEAQSPWLPTVRGDFGHSWDLWPVCLAKYVADMREGERRMLAAESLVAMVSSIEPKLTEATRAARQRAEWCWAMLSDHAWNGTDERNQRHNAELRRRWSAELNQLATQITQQAEAALKMESSPMEVLLFNSLSFPRRGLVSLNPQGKTPAATAGGGTVPCQVIEEDGRQSLCFVSPEVPGFGWRQVRLDTEASRPASTSGLKATPSRLEGPYYRATVDLRTGGLSSLVHRQTGKELLVPGQGRTLGQSVYFDGKEHTLTDVRCEVAALGPVLARLRIRGMAAGIEIASLVTVYAELDQVDFDIRIRKPVSTREERLCQVFPILEKAGDLRIATPGAVIRPRKQPDGDLLPGADTRRFAVQEFVDVSSDGVGVTVAPLDAFALRLDLGPPSMEALGNDQNYREVVKDQHGQTDFRFRYSLQARSGGYDGARATVFGRGAATPLSTFRGCSSMPEGVLPALEILPSRAVATCLKPADDPIAGGHIVRLIDTTGRAGPVTMGLKGYRRAMRTDLLERDREELEFVDGKLTVELKPYGVFAARLLP